MGSGHRNNKDRLLTVLKINIVVFIAEVIAGYISGSLSMISDSFHVSLHVFASAVALTSEYEFLGINPKNIKLWSAIINIALFFPLAYGIASEALNRWSNPPTIDLSIYYFLAAFLGLFANLYTVFILKPEKHVHGHGENHCEQENKNHNRFILYIHMIFDTIGSIIVIGGAIEIYRTANYFIDPVASLILSVLIVLAALWMSWELFKGHDHHH